MADYSAWVIDYGQTKQAPKSALVYGAHNQEALRLPYCCVVLKGQGQLAMIDVGYYYYEHARTFEDRFGPRDWHTPTEALGLIGVNPEDVDTIFPTHAHFDHMGNLPDFPNAHVYIQEEELAKQVWAMSLPPRLQFPLIGADPADVLTCAELVQRGKITMVQGDVEDIFPGIDLRLTADTHSPGHLYVVIRNDRLRDPEDCWVFAGDLAYSKLNFRGSGALVGADWIYTPIGLATGSNTKCVLAIEEMKKRAKYDERRVIAIHEADLAEQFPSRIVEAGLRVIETCLATGEQSKV